MKHAWIVAVGVWAGCAATDTKTEDTDVAEIETDGTDTDGVATDTDVSTDTDATSDTDQDSDVVLDTDPTDDPFYDSAPGEGGFVWLSATTASPDTCGFQGFMIGNGYIVSNVNDTEKRFTLQPDSGGFFDPSTCQYETSGAFSCTPAVKVYDMADYGLVGTVTMTIHHEGTFVERTRSVGGGPHTFSPSWAFDAVSQYDITCSGSPGDCQSAATMGWGFTALPCAATVTANTMCLDDPSLP